ncbi:MAG: hypothetical protein WCQ77_00370 [Planctomycetota bacterium]
MLQVAVDRPDDRPAVLEMGGEHWVGPMVRDDVAHIRVRRHARGYGPVAGQAARSHHPPQSLLDYQLSRRVGERVGQPVVLMIGPIAAKSAGCISRIR